MELVAADFCDTNALQLLSSWRGSLASKQVAGNSQAAQNNCNCTSSACASIAEEETFSIWIELLEDCNLDCVFCYNPWRPRDSLMRQRRKLGPEELRSVLGRIFETLTVDHVTLSGGEPLLYPDLPELVAELREHCDSVGMTTNGRSLTRARMAALANAGVNHVSIPLHSSEALVHDELAGGVSWKAAIRALVHCREAGISTALTAVVTRRNVDSIRRVCRIALELGIETVVLNGFHPTGQGDDRPDLMVTAAEFEDVVDSAREDVAGRLNILVGAPPVGRHVAKTVIDRLVISPHGDLKFCNQSTAGVINLIEEPAALSTLLEALARGRAQEYVGLVDSCTCFTAKQPSTAELVT